MPQTQSPVEVVRVDYTCDECLTGLMRATGMLLMTNPPQYPHICTECDAHKNFKVRYPTIEYKETQ